jgi:hypothetical protein
MIFGEDSDGSTSRFKKIVTRLGVRRGFSSEAKNEIEAKILLRLKAKKVIF